MDQEKFERISKRARAVIAAHCWDWPLRGRYKKLEEQTGIAERKWKMLNNKVTFVTVETLLALSELRPEFAAFLLTGNSFPPQIGYMNEEEAERYEKETNQRSGADLFELDEGVIAIPDFKKMLAQKVKD